MSNRIELHFVYPRSSTIYAKLEVYERLLDTRDVSSRLSRDDAAQRARETDEGIVNVRYRSLHPTVMFDRPFGVLADVPQIIVSLEQREFDERFHSPEEITENVCDTIDLARDVYECSVEAGHRPVYVIGSTPTETELLRTDHGRIRTTEEGVFAGEMEELYWLQILAPEMVDSVGRETLESAPAWRVEDLDDGSVLLVAFENPLFVGDEYFDLLEHLSLTRE